MGAITDTFLNSTLVMDIILPFVLVFVLIFAILQRSKLLGEDKNQMDMLVALAIAFMTVGVSQATNLITKIIPFLSVTAVLILVFYILLSFALGGTEKTISLKGWSVAIGIIVSIAMVIAVLVITGYWEGVGTEWLTRSNIAELIVVLLIVVGAIMMVMGPPKNSGP